MMATLYEPSPMDSKWDLGAFSLLLSPIISNFAIPNPSFNDETGTEHTGMR